MRNTALILLLFCSLQIFYAQNFSITGKLLNEDKSALISSQVILRNKKDSIVVKVSISDNQGDFVFKNISNGEYLINIVDEKIDISHKTIKIIDESINLGNIIVYNRTKLIDEVVITKPLIEKKINKTIINVENSIYKVGEDTYRLLNISPEIQADNIGNITFRGNESVTIYMDGRIMRLEGRELMGFLKSIPSESIKNIEISSVPSAEFDASSKGAIININTKKNYKYGLTGNIYNEMQQHRYFQWNSGLFLRYRKQKIITQMNYSFGTGRGFNDNNDTQTFFDKPIQFNQHEDYREKIGVHNLNLGFDYEINEKNLLGTNYNLNYWDGTTSGVSTNLMKNTINYNVDSIYVTNNRRPLKLNNQSLDLFYKYKIDSLGSKINFGYNYLNYNNVQDSYLENKFYDQYGQILRQSEFFAIKNPLKINIHTINFDLNKLLKNDLTIQFGSKYISSKTNNSIQYYDGINEMFNKKKSNDFLYNEDILSFYSSMTKKWKKWGINLGMRVENTKYDANSPTMIQSFSQSRWDLFPSIFIEYKPSEKNSFNLSYGRRITRPPFRLLNPFENVQNPFFITKGNPFLKPYFSNSLEFTYSLNKKHNFTAYYQKNTAIINNIFNINTNNQTISTFDNINDESMYLISYSTYFDIYKWWNFNVYTNVVYRKITVNNSIPQSYEKVTPYIRISNTFKIQDNFYIDLNGNYFSKSFYSIYDLYPQGVINLSVRKSFFENKLSASLNFNDLFNVKRIRMNIDEASFNKEIENRYATRSVSLRLSYNFSKGKKKTDRQNVESINNNEVNRINQ